MQLLLARSSLTPTRRFRDFVGRAAGREAFHSRNRGVNFPRWVVLPGQGCATVQSRLLRRVILPHIEAHAQRDRCLTER